MLLNEHQSKRLFGKAGVAVPQGYLIGPDDLDRLDEIVPPTEGPLFVKAQVLTGGRGKAGGIVRVDDRSGLRTACEKVLAMDIKGHAVPLVRIEPGSSFNRECYLSFVVSRGRESLVFTVSGQGGVEVEDAGNVLVQNVDPAKGLESHQLRAAFFHMFRDVDPATLGEKGLKPFMSGFAKLVTTLYQAVMDNGLLLAEINPLVVDEEGNWTALDGKVEIDDNVRDLRPELEEFYQPEHASPEENAARAAGLSYVELDGWVGLVVNGAGLAMATMDLLNLSGVTAANFMDLGGAANKERMATALTLLFDHPKVQAVFLNLFGGIVSCRTVAEALAGALDGGAPKKPLVVRMAGNGSAEGREILSSLNQPAIHLAEEMDQALNTLREVGPNGDRERTTVEVVEHMDMQTASRPALGLSKDSRVLVQGITGRAARNHVGLMREYGTNITAGVTPFKGGQDVDGVPVYDSVQRALDDGGPVDASIIFVPGAFAADAILEAIRNEIPYAICITEGIPQRDMLQVRAALAGSATTLIGPNTPGIIVPGETKIGIMPAMAFSPGPVAVFSRSGTLTYEAAARLTGAGIGQSVGVGIGGDPFVGARFVELVDRVRDDDAVRVVVVLGEIGGNAEETLAGWVRETGFHKPIVSFIAGRTAPPGKRLGHAGAILEEGGGGIEAKLKAMEDAGFIPCPDLMALPRLVAQVL